MRIFSFCVVVLISLFSPVWVFIAVAIVYALFFKAYELVPLALCIDAQFGDPSRGLWYTYTLSVVLILLVTVYGKSYLRFY